MPEDPSDDSPGSRRGALIALLVVVIIVVGGILLEKTLSSTGHLQDCVMSGRSNCAPIQSGG